MIGTTLYVFLITYGGSLLYFFWGINKISALLAMRHMLQLIIAIIIGFIFGMELSH